MRAKGASFLAFGEALALAADKERVKPAEHGVGLGVSPATVYDWIKQLRFQRAIVETVAADRVDRRRLLQVYTAHRMAELFPATELDVGAAGASATLARHGVAHALGLFSAANEWAFFESRGDLQLYVERSDVPRLRSLLPAGPRRLQVFPERMSDLPVKQRGDLPVTGPFRTLLDLRAHPEGGAHAAFLETNLYRWGARA